MRLIGLVLAVVLAHSLVLVPLAAEAQRQDKIWRIGLIHVGLDHVPPSVVSLHEELRALGCEDGRNIRLDFRNVADQAAANITAQQVVRDQVDLIVAFEEQAMRGVKAATSAIPVVFLHLVDPVADGFIESLARPGGNVTGFITYSVSPSKQVELFSEVVPRPRQLLVLVDLKDPIARRTLPELRSAGATRRIHLAERGVSCG